MPGATAGQVTLVKGVKPITATTTARMGEPVGLLSLVSIAEHLYLAVIPALNMLEFVCLNFFIFLFICFVCT